MKALVFDVETTGAQRNKGNPFDPRNKLMCIGFKGKKVHCWNIEHQPEPYKEQLDQFQEYVDRCDVLVGFNLKYDMHWAKRYGISFINQDLKVWDCQLYYFFKTNQQGRMPSLNDV